VVDLSKLAVVGARFSYPGGFEALRGASFSLREGEIVGVLGPSGCGKTTLLLVAAGLLEPLGGEVLLDGEPLRDQLPEARKRLGIVFQEPDDQLFNPTVKDELAFALRQLGLSEATVDEKVKAVAAALGLTHLLNKPAFALSGGEKKRVAIASVLVYDPEVLLLDEPTAYLDSRWKKALESLLIELKASGAAVAVATHDVDFAARVTDRVYLMVDGRVAAEGPAREILSDERLLSEAGLEPPGPVAAFKALRGVGRPPLSFEELRATLAVALARRFAFRSRSRLPRSSHRFNR
jgi:cobalt/nickel transport system ATP-binding protein